MGYLSREDSDSIHAYYGAQLALANGDKLDERRLLTILLARSLTHDHASKLSDKLLQQFEDLSTLFSLEFDELASVNGVSEQIAVDLFQIKHLLSAISWAIVSEKPIIDCYEKLTDYCARQFAGVKKEQFHVLFLNKGFELLHHTCLQTGTLDHVTVYPREVLRTALKYSASHLILAHNHPFGKAKPSRADITMTKQLDVLAEGLGIGILDHIIFAENNTFSFLKNNLMPHHTANLFEKLQPKNLNNWD